MCIEMGELVMSAIPALRRFKKGDRVYVRAQQVWLVLTSKVMSSDRDWRRPTVLTYGDLALAMGLDPRAGLTLARPLGIVGWLCVDNDLPTLNSIVVNELTNAPGDHVVTRDHKSYKEEQAEVMKINWHTIRVPTTGTLRKVWESMRMPEDG